MYAGKIVERAAVMEVFDSPAHPYTRPFWTRPSAGGPEEREAHSG